jgi:hypothetical protein
MSANYAGTGIHRGTGRPKGKSWSSLIEEISTSEVDASGESLKRQIVKQLLYAARDRQGWAMAIVMDRMEGKVVQGVDMTTGGESLNASINFVGAPAPELPVVEAEVIECQAEEPTKILIT